MKYAVAMLAIESKPGETNLEQHVCMVHAASEAEAIGIGYQMLGKLFPSRRHYVRVCGDDNVCDLDGIAIVKKR